VFKRAPAVAVGCLLFAAPAAAKPDPTIVTIGTASWYGAWHHGKPMANGRPFDMNADTVAHRTLPLGTCVRVENLANGRSVVAAVTDRGPYVGNRILDASRGVARALGFEQAGLARVSITSVACRERRGLPRAEGRPDPGRPAAG